MQEVIEVTENWVTVCKKSRNFFVNGGIYFVDILFHRRLVMTGSPVDNASYYHSKEVKAFVKTSKVELVYLPAYSPNLNLIEHLWKFLHKEVL